MSLTTADIIIVVVILFLAIKGVITGFAKEIVSILGIVGGIYSASHFSYNMAEMMKSKLFATASITTLKFVAFIIILAVVWWSISVVGKFLDRGEQRLYFISRIGGYIIAIFKYFIVISLILFVMMQTPSLKHKSFGKSIVSSKIYPYMKKSASWLLNANKVAVKSSNTTNRK